MIKRILIANRGEIAVRIIRTCKEMGIETVAVYSTADKEALHVQLATQAVCIGGPKSQDSYLHMQNILSAACSTGCDGIHPGFGFLSENAKFARLVQQCGMKFIGPSAEVIEKMGDKATARKMMIEAGIPVVPGSDLITDVQEGVQFSNQIGYPVLIKATAGGGGRGMRIAHCAEDFETAFFAAKIEAKNAFGNDQVYIEKLIEQPKHIEIQVLCDEFGNTLHLFERDCSLQRRNQKILEEAPCHTLSQDLRDRMCNDALKACQTTGYDSVGTIEFLLDKQGFYYFIEMNTRIQVEHTVSEMITGIDLIKQQIKVADHKKLTLTQDDIVCKGYAMECRINAEDMKANFSPRAGKIEFLNLPGGKGIRIDTAVYPGYTIPPYYDSMILKLISFGETRLECIKKMRWALEECMIEGVPTNIEFQYLLLHNKNFVEGKFDTSFLETFIKEINDNGTII